MTKQTLAELVTVENLKAWLKTKNPNETYDYSDSDVCCVTQFAREHGYPLARAGGDYVREGVNTAWDEPHTQLPDDISSAVVRKPRTFGGVLERLG